MKTYVGRSLDTGKLAVFHSDVEPTEETHGDRFRYAIGPFRTVDAARLMVKCVGAHMFAVSVEDCERFARTNAEEACCGGCAGCCKESEAP